ncbi:LysE family translocator [Oricola thermophila]|uniref:LysE family translocator n=1 Tax=Oricola thermophila TaxID=2742145 RepID=A0A6N1VGR2_9HYPH|nr:LysE family translocator [Oricola thermophila]QKV18197.1 LysE family translocator [Oricola thermophila]
MIDPHAWLAFAIASFLIVIVPGPSVTVIIANSLRAGSRAGLMNVAGTQVGVLTMIVILAVGLKTVVALVGEAFIFLKVAGALYLVWLGWKLLSSDGSLGQAGTEQRKRSLQGYFWQGFVVIWSNPKALFLFGAFIPQFVSGSGNPVGQTVMLGMTFVVIASVCDSMYALAAGRTGGWLNRKNIRLVERISGTCLVGGGLWMLAARRSV